MPLSWKDFMLKWSVPNITTNSTTFVHECFAHGIEVLDHALAELHAKYPYLKSGAGN